MKLQELEEFGAVLGATLSLYDKTPSDEVALLWFEALKQFEISDIRIALTRHVQDPDAGRFSPKPADVIAHLAGGAATRGMRAWTLVEKAVRSVGHYRSVCFDDPVINKLVDEMGGWVKLASTATEEDLKFRGIEFAKRYQGIMQTGGVGADYPPYLIGASESHNAVEGMRVEPPALIGDPVKAQQVLTRGQGSTALKVTDARKVAALANGAMKLIKGGK
jgi:Domain of unknown function (DUF6475)